jgi:hypothetical protein
LLYKIDVADQHHSTEGWLFGPSQPWGVKSQQNGVLIYSLSFKTKADAIADARKWVQDRSQKARRSAIVFKRDTGSVDFECSYGVGGYEERGGK